jgi:flagellar basal-body rod protein FlgF
MENALLIGLSRQMALAHQMDVVANNMANTATAGYKAEALKFEEYLMPVAGMEGAQSPSGDLSYVIDAKVLRDYQAGELRMTGNPFDAALNGEGWFAVDTPNGERYTRDGHFTLDAQGTLVNASGHPVLGEAGRITIAPDETDFTIASDATVSTSGGEKGRLRVVTFENQDAFSKEGFNLYVSAAEPVPADRFRIAQGYLEDSNVQAVTETAHMIEVMRAYIATAKQLERLADLKLQAINKLGTLQA